ncbi:MAG: TolB family protein, partial [Nocardioidaceae bacterium]
AQEGFSGTVSDPWYVVSARTGDYARLSAPHLDQVRGHPWVSPDGTRIAWSWPGGISVYDTIAGGTGRYPPGASAGKWLAWSPDGTRIAYGSDPVRVLDTRTGEVVDLGMRLTDAGVTPGWTADGHWLTVPVQGALEAVRVNSGERRRVPSGVGELRSAAWNRADHLAGLLRMPTGESLRVLRAGALTATGLPDGQSTVARSGRPNLVISDLWGWLGNDEVVLTGLDPDSGALELAMAYSVRDRTLRHFMQVPDPEGNFAGIATMSVAADVLQQPTRDYPEERDPWSPAAKLTLCMLVAVFPMLYFLVARRPRR